MCVQVMAYQVLRSKVRPKAAPTPRDVHNLVIGLDVESSSIRDQRTAPVRSHQRQDLSVRQQHTSPAQSWPPHRQCHDARRRSRTQKNAAAAATRARLHGWDWHGRIERWRGQPWGNGPSKSTLHLYRLCWLIQSVRFFCASSSHRSRKLYLQP
jgi:hypothetical protein